MKITKKSAIRFIENCIEANRRLQIKVLGSSSPSKDLRELGSYTLLHLTSLSLQRNTSQSIL